MADNRTMAQMLQAPIEGYEDAIVVPLINANNFELKQTLINLVQRLLCQCPHHGFSELHQLDTFYNSLNTNDQDALDSAAGGNFLDKMPRDGLAIIESKSKIGLKDALVEMPKFNKWLSSLLRNKEKLKEIAITTVNAECSAIIMNKVPEKLEDPGKFLIPCALQELDRTNVQEGNFQDHSNPLFEFDDNFKSSTINPLFDEMEEDVEIKNSNVSDEPVLLNTPLSDKVECFAPEDDNDEIDAFLAMEVSSNFEEGYFDSEGDVTFLDNLLSNDASHNLASEVISDHEPEQNESSITFSPRSDPLHHEFAGELLTLPSRNDREFGEYLSLMTVLCEISTSQSQENVHANQSSIIESLPVSPILRK
ncbi:hypothetical protein Tco_0144993 [Tanacetum coccineum]